MRGELVFRQILAPWHFLYFLPEPQKQGSLRPISVPVVRCVDVEEGEPPAWRAASRSRCLLRWNSRSNASMVVEGARVGMVGGGGCEAFEG